MRKRPRGAKAAADAPAPRKRAAAIDLDEPKERVLHTRVPQFLDRQLKDRARNLGLSVSTVVRNVLLNTFGLVEDIVTDSANVAFSITGDDAPDQRGHAPRRPARSANGGVGEVVGWQEAMLNVNAVCERCNAMLRKGTHAAIALLDPPGRPRFLCKRCLGAVAPEPQAPARRR